MLKKISEPLPLIMTNQEGTITDCSKTLKGALKYEGINIDSLKSAHHLITTFSGDNNAMNQVYGTELNKTNLLLKEITIENSTRNDQITEFDTTSRPLWKAEEGLTDRSRNFGVNVNIIVEQFTERSNLPPRKAIKEMSDETAKIICERLMKGKKIELCQTKSSKRNKKEKLIAKIQMHPYLSGYEVYKIIKMTNIGKEDFFISETKTEISQTQNYISEETVDNDSLGTNERNFKEPSKPSKSQFNKNAITTESDLEIEDEDDEEQQNKFSMSFNEIQEQKRDMVRVKVNNDDQLSSVMGSYQQESLVISAIKRLTTRKKILPIIYWLRITIILFMFSLIILSIVKFVQTGDTIQQIEKGLNLVYVTNLRLQAAVNTWLWSLVILTNAFPINDVLPNLVTEVNKLSIYNGQLQNRINQDVDDKTKKFIFGKHINLWRVSDDGRVISDKMDAYTATDYLIQKYLPISKISDWTQLAYFPDLPQTFNNTANDYFLVSEIAIKGSLLFLPIIVSNGITSLEIILGLSLSIIGLLGIYFIIVAMNLSSGHAKLCRSLINTQEESVISRINLLQKTKTLFENDIERKAFIEEAHHLVIDDRKEAVKFKTGNHNKVFNMKQMNKFLSKITMFAIIPVPIFMFLFILSTMKTKDTYDSLISFTEDVSLLSEGSALSNMIMSSIVYQTLFQNVPTMLVRYRPPEVQVQETLLNFVDLNERFSKRFLTNPSITVDPIIEDILERDVCKYINVELMHKLCLDGTKNQAYGLLQLNTQYYMTLKSMMEAMGTALNLVEAAIIFATVSNEVIGMMATLESIYPILISHVLGVFENQEHKAEFLQMMINIGFCLVSIVYLIFLFKKPLKELRRIDLGRRKVLKIIPFHIFQENKALKFYLLQNFRKEIDNVKNIL